MEIVRNRAIVADSWRHALDGAELPPGDLIVPLERWLAERESLLERRGRLGVRIRPGDDLARLAPDLHALRLVAIEFTAFHEGRGYSQARWLRERYGFRGEIRAVGDVARDRIAFMERCGIDAFELREGEDPHAVLAAFDEISVRYQPAADDARVVRELRGTG